MTATEKGRQTGCGPNGLVCLFFAKVKNKKPTISGGLSIPFSAGGLSGGLAAFSLLTP